MREEAVSTKPAASDQYPRGPFSLFCQPSLILVVFKFSREFSYAHGSRRSSKPFTHINSLENFVFCSMMSTCKPAALHRLAPLSTLI